MMEIELDGVREYCEGETPILTMGGKWGMDSTKDEGFFDNKDRIVIKAYNEGGHNSTCVDLLDLLEWLKEHKEEIGLSVIGI